MLTKRTNILFDEKTWSNLVALADKKNTSVGDLVRIAVMTVYLDKNNTLIQQRKNAATRIEAIKKNIKHTFSNNEIRELVTYGRK